MVINHIWVSNFTNDCLRQACDNADRPSMPRWSSLPASFACRLVTSNLEQVTLRLFRTARHVLSFVLRVSYGLNVWRNSRRSILRVIESSYITVTAWISSIECVRCNLCCLIVSLFPLFCYRALRWIKMYIRRDVTWKRTFGLHAFQSVQWTCFSRICTI